MADLRFDVTALDNASRTFARMAASVETLERRLAALDRQRAEAEVSVDTRKAERGLGRLDRSMGDMVIRVAALGRALGTIALPAALIASTPGILSVAAAAVEASAALYLLPAAGVAAAVGIGTLVVGLTNMADALGPTGTPAQLEKVAEAMAQLAPSARATVTEIRALGPAWTSLRLDVQERLFGGVSEQVRVLGGIYLPILQDVMSRVASSFNYAAHEVGRFLAEPATVADFSTGLSNIENTLENLSKSIAPIVRAFTDIFVVGAQFMPGLMASFAAVTERFSAFIENARATGDLARWIQEAIDTIGQLGSVVGSTGGILKSMMEAATSAGADTLGSLESLTGELDNFLSIGAGHEALVTIFETINGAVQALLPGLLAIASALAVGIVALGPALVPLADAIAQVAIALAPLISDLASLVSVVLPPLTDGLREITPLLGPIAAGFLAVYTQAKLMAAAGVVMATLGPILAGLRVAWTAFILSFVAGPGIIAALGAAFATLPISVVIGAVLALGAAFVFAWRHSETFRGVVIGAWEGIQSAVGAVWVWMQGVWASFQQIMNDVAGAFVAAWDGIKAAAGSAVAALAPVWHAIVAGFQAAGNAAMALWADFIRPVTEFIAVAIMHMVAVVATILLTPWVLAFQAAAAVVSSLWTIVQPTFQRIGDFIASVWAAISAAFRTSTAVVQGVWSTFWNALSSVASAMFATIRGGIESAWAVIRAVFQSVSGQVQGIWTVHWNILSSVASSILNTISGAISTAWGAIRGMFQSGTATVSGVWRPFWDGLSSVASSVFATIRSTINSVIDGIIAAFQRVVGTVGRIWGGIRVLLAKPVNFLINTVYTGGIKKAWDIVAGLLPGVGPAPRITPIPEFARGGAVMSDTLLRAGEAGPEYILSAPAVRAMGGIPTVDQMHRQALGRAPARRATMQALNSGRIVEGADHEGPGYSTAGFGGVKPHVAKAGHYLQRRFGVRSVGGVGQRANASDHPKGLALDFMTYSDLAKGDALVNYLTPRAGHFGVKYIIWKQRINSGSGWRGMADRGSVTANHFDHPHVSFRDGPGGGGFAGGGDTGGGFFDIKAWIRQQVVSLTDPLITSLRRTFPAPPRFMDIPPAAATKVRDMGLDFLLGKAYDQGGIASGPGLLAKRTLDPERVLSPRQTVAFERLVDTVSTPRSTSPSVSFSNTEVVKELRAVRAELMSRPQQVITQNIDGSRDPVETGYTAALALKLHR